ncbi:GAF domain-containing protein [Limnoraphis robusta Tam1]|uniref:GAF domain-containing protein n=1 Tax=Limnoraphis robusta CCNP1315 TaxID=3110306 RepID=A0ABU5TYZ6_9CYAN|nr:GAF domain-containing protein [Limnoraphis robusta]MEA5500721.1 GAF domain-containing protein [Limnoraphis robusta BA-68 BA1]MEA5520157.1 GAF domain-containing protein [Limnoraphis robusta CCNP1315]MEA5541778.1 GAF domain-containing protein [Limnoraphis robusta Tam1]MEA5543874.1 GAF domain-containing protein [Limnoraphis robusta CCNP1324]
MGQHLDSAGQVEGTTLSQVLQTLREEENVDILLQISLSYLQAKYNYRLIWVGLYDRLDHQLVGKGGISQEEESSFLKKRFPLKAGDLLEQVVIQLRPMIIADLQTETRAGDWCKFAKTYNIRSTLFYPLRHKDRCLGLVLLGSSQWGRTPESNETEELSIVLGGLATALNHIETEWQRQQSKHPSSSILKLLSEFRSFARLDHYLEAVVKESHRFIQPARTNIYWYHQDGHYFWRRSSNLKKTPEPVITRAASGINVQDLTEFYQALASDQLVVIGQSHSTLKAEMTQRLMRRMRVRSLLAAPIIFNHELLGFLALEGKHPRIWQTGDKTFVRGMAQLLGVIAPLTNMNDTIQEIQQDRALTAEITRAIVSDQDWQMLLTTTVKRLCDRLNTDYCFILQKQPTQQQFEVLYQNPLSHHRLLTTPLASLTPSDQDQLEETGVISLEQWDFYSTLSAWNEPLSEIGVKSVLLGLMSQHPALNMTTDSHCLLVIGHINPRTWTQAEQELVKIVAQQLGLILHQWQLDHQVEVQQRLGEMITTGWQIVQQTDQVHELERCFTEEISQALSSPLVLLVTWTESQKQGQIIQRYEHQQPIRLDTDITIDIDRDLLIQQTLLTEGVYHQDINDLPISTRQWLNPQDDSDQIWAIALRTHPDHQSTGILILADPYLQPESEQTFQLLEGLVSQLAWMRRYLRVVSTLYQEREELQWLNWYKQRRLEELYRVVGSRVKQLHELKQSPFLTVEENKHQLTNLRYQQLLRQISQTLASTSSLLKREQWQLHNRQDLVVVSSLLRRMSERLQPLMIHRQLLLEIQQQRNLTLIADSVKLELVLYELLLIACYRSPSKGVIKITVQPLDEQKLELVISDRGIVNPQLIRDLEAGTSADVLKPSSLDRPPGQHLMIVARIIEQMGGQFQLQQLDSGEMSSRLILPVNFS